MATQPEQPLKLTLFDARQALWFDCIMVSAGVRYKDWSDRDHRGIPTVWHFYIYGEDETQ